MSSSAAEVRDDMIEDTSGKPRISITKKEKEKEKRWRTVLLYKKT